MEQVQERVKSAVDSLVDDLDKKYFREMQRKVYLCSADCCTKKDSRQGIETCVDRCNNPLQKVQNVLEHELGTLQQQMSRCAMTAYDKAVQQLGPDPSKYSDSQMKTFQDKIEAGVHVCADDHLKLLPQIKARIIENLK